MNLISRRTFTHRLAFLGLGLATLLAFSGTAQAWWNKDWTIRKKITIDTSDKGVAISDPIGTVTVLVRLHDGNFQFGAGMDDASDLRFVAADDKTLLPFHVEKFDAVMNEAFVWVKVPDVKPGAQTSFWLYYGNMKAEKAENAKGSYDSDTALVYHFGEHGTPANDSTSQGNNAQNEAIAVDGAMIGGGLRFGGHNPVTVPASPSLNWGDGEKFTFSTWLKPVALAPNALLLSREEGGNAFRIGVDNGVPYVEVQNASGVQRSTGGEPLAVNAWKNLAVVSEGSKISVYVEGTLYGSVNAAVPALNGPIILGGDASGGQGFNGEVDEMELSRVARSAGYVKVLATTQGGESKLLVEDPDEQASAGWFSGGFGLFGVLLKSVTVDGWIVIGLLVVMAGVSWFVMVSKFLYLQKITKGTEEFLREWNHLSADLTVIDHSDADSVKTLGGRVDSELQELMLQAPLYHIYHIGSEEIRNRLSQAKDNFAGLPLRSIQAIRASLDSGLIRESHNLNGLMVFLTIAIAGGPYLGLLGTVVGVMITFAEIASSGEVNINAIAPGIAAALIATVAGLVVAIPALFGYNYLNARIKDLVSTMQMFIDEFVTKMAEYYPPRAE